MRTDILPLDFSGFPIGRFFIHFSRAKIKINMYNILILFKKKRFLYIEILQKIQLKRLLHFI